MTQLPPTQTYFRNLGEGRFMLQHSPSTGEWVFYPRMIAPKTGATGGADFGGAGAGSTMWQLAIVPSAVSASWPASPDREPFGRFRRSHPRELCVRPNDERETSCDSLDTPPCSVRQS